MISASATPLPAFSAGSSASSSSSSSNSSSSTFQIAALPCCSSETTRAAIYNGSAVTMWSYSSGILAALWTVGAREGIGRLSMCRVTCDVDGDSDDQASHVTRHVTHVVRSARCSVVAASAGGGISVVVTVDAAAKQLLVRAVECSCEVVA